MDIECNHTDEHFKGQQATEEVEFVLRKHWIILVPRAMIYCTLFIILNYFSFIILTNPDVLNSREVIQIVALIAMLVGIYYMHSVFNRLLNYYLEIVIMTNYRLIDLHKTLFLHDDKDAIDLHEIQEIQKHQDGLWKNLLNYGEITLVIAGVPQTRCISFIPKPDKYFRRIIKAKRDYILKRREHKTIENPVYEPRISLLQEH